MRLPPIRRVFVAAVVIAVAYVAPASEVTGGLRAGPLHIPGTTSAEPSGWLCLRKLPGNPPLRFYTLMENTGTEPVTITDVSLVAARRMELAGAYVARWGPRGGHNPPIGSRYPMDMPVAGITADDAELPAGTTWAFVVGVRSAGSDSALNRVRVDYWDAAGNQYWGMTGDAVIIRSRCRNSAAEWPEDFQFPG